MQQVDAVLCKHCHLPSINPIKTDEGHIFCCQGCLTVYQFLSQENLLQYYSIKKDTSLQTAELVGNEKTRFEHLDQSEFLKDHTILNGDGTRQMDFYIKGLECLACVWVLEKIPEIYLDAISVHVDLSTSMAHVTLTSTGKFSKVAELMQNFGYVPLPLESNQTWMDEQKKENRSRLLRIGVAAACAGNVMIFSVPLYAGQTNEYQWLFQSAIALVSLPSLFYCALPLYQGAWRAVRNKRVSLDVPLTTAIFLGSAISFYQMFRGSDHFYFDSITALIFLILGSRHLQLTFQRKAEATNRLLKYNQKGSVERYDVKSNSFVSVDNRYLKKGDLIKIHGQSPVPADGYLEGSELAYLNNSLLTGESLPVRAGKKTPIFAGSINMGAPFTLRVEGTGEDTRIGRIIRSSLMVAKKEDVSSRADKIAHYFLLVVLVTATVVFVIEAINGNIHAGIEKSLSMIIIACPCALGLATPLAFSRSLALAIKKKIFIKDASVFEKMLKARRIFFDKTGTLTGGSLKVLNVTNINKGEKENLNLVFSLEKFSLHPVARTLSDFCLSKGAQELPVVDAREIPGRGVEGAFLGERVSIEKGEEGNVILMRGGIPAMTFFLEDAPRSDAFETVDYFRKNDISPALLSGDGREKVRAMADSMGIRENETYFEVSPERKVEIISENPASIMVGDGANDSLALKKAFVSVAVSGGVEASLKASDVYLSSQGLRPLRELFLLSKSTMSVVKRNLMISFFYNVAGLTLAATGHVTPLIAAIVMPISSLCVLGSTLFGTREIRRMK